MSSKEDAHAPEYRVRGGELDFPLDPEEFAELLRNVELMELVDKKPIYPGVERLKPENSTRSRKVINGSGVGEKTSEILGLENDLIGEVYCIEDNSISILLGTETLGRGDGYKNPLNYSVRKEGKTLIHSFRWKGTDSPDTETDYEKRILDAYGDITMSNRDDVADYMEIWTDGE